jgi:hypothetical protein
MTRTALILAVLLTAPAASPPASTPPVANPAPTFIVAISPSGDPAPTNAPAPESRAVTTAPAPGQAPRSAPVVPGGFTAAPIPDADLDAPVHRDPNDSQASLGPKLFNTHDSYRGDGFLYKSTPQSEQEKRLKPTPGVGLSVPLQ